MAPGEPYRGPVTLGASKHARPQFKDTAAALPTATLSPTPPHTMNGNSNVIMVKEKLAAAKEVNAKLNPDAQLALVQNESLKKDMEKHSAKITTSVSNAVANTHQILHLLRESIRKENPASAEAGLQAVDSMWTGLQRLAEAAEESKAVLPVLLDKQKGSMSLYHASMVNEAYKEVQEELNAQHRKVNLQHSLILDHQQAFQDYKADVEPKLQQIGPLQDRAQNLMLSNGNLKDELNKAQQELKVVRVDKDEYAGKLSKAEEKLNAMVSTAKGLTAERDELRKTIDAMQVKLRAHAEKTISCYEIEIRRLNELYQQELNKSKALETQLYSLKTGDPDGKKKLQFELHQLQERYKNQTLEHSKLLNGINETAKINEGLTVKVKHLEKLNIDHEAKLHKVHDDLEKEKAERQTKWQKQVDELQTALRSAEDEGKQAKKEYDSVARTLQQVKKENDGLEEENNELRAKEMEQKKNPEKADVADKDTLEKLRQAEATIITVRKDLKEWTALAEKSYKEYQGILPLSKKADAYRAENAQLKAQVSTLEARSNLGGNADDKDLAYWRAKYEKLLADCAS